MPENRGRVVIEGVAPEVDCGEFPAKRIAGEPVVVEADIFCDGHDLISARLLHRAEGDEAWTREPMELLVNDRWRGVFTPSEPGLYRYTIEAAVDHFSSWRSDLRKKADAGQDVAVDLLAGAGLVRQAAGRAKGGDRASLVSFAEVLEADQDQADAVGVAWDPMLASLMAAHADQALFARYGRELMLVVDRRKALFSTWYERFPRSASPEPGRHGTFEDMERLLPEIARMGFDVLYLPPIHPIGQTSRKGRNNAPAAGPSDVGSPWAIGAFDGGHDAIHPKLGTFEQFEHMRRRAAELGIELALDIAFQCSPDHPWVREHPEWFRVRPDGSIQYAENPPKKYEDIVPLNFETSDAQGLWNALKDVFLFWIDRRVRIFRVDNPHTKSLEFWRWVIPEVKREEPGAIFLSEAFTRPKVMYRLAKLGFSQSYTYFTWRSTKRELTSYLEELTKAPARDFFRPSFWPNTPDILPEHLQYGGRPAFLMRLILAATLSASYGIYGPAFELTTADALPGREEYQDSEKYEIRAWDWDAPGNLRDLVARVNGIRRENPALQDTFNLRFLETDNDAILYYLKRSADGGNILLVAVNLDPYHVQSGRIHVPTAELGIDPASPYLAHDLLSDDKFIWQGEWNHVELNPFVLPARIFRLRPRLRREQDFDYFM